MYLMDNDMYLMDTVMYLMDTVMYLMDTVMYLIDTVMYLMDTALAVILLVFEMLKIPSIKVQAHFLKNLAFVTSKYLAQDASENIQGKQKTFPNTQQYANSFVHKFPYYLLYSTKLSSSLSYIGNRGAVSKLI